MNSKIQVSLIEKIKRSLNVETEIELVDLYDLLYKTRASYHPDRYSDDESRKQATDRFIEYSNLLKELKLHIDRIKIEKSGSELVIYENNIEAIQDKNHILSLEEQISDLKSALKEKEDLVVELSSSISKLNITLKNVRDNHLNELNKNLEKLYKPKSQNLFYLGASTLTLIIVNLLKNIQSIKGQIVEFFPFDISYLNILFFSIILIVILNFCINRYTFNKIQNIAERLKTNKVLTDFFEKQSEKEYMEHGREYFFTESKIEQYIETNFFENRYFKVFGRLNIDFRTKNLSYLKQVFIYNLIEKDLIKIGKAEKLDRKFTILE